VDGVAPEHWARPNPAAETRILQLFKDERELRPLVPRAGI